MNKWHMVVLLLCFLVIGYVLLAGHLQHAVGRIGFGAAAGVAMAALLPRRRQDEQTE
ncbi:hypothetical protein [Brevibacillus dissolubilis]|uniref:hypothetical protein n=1 Tax=Brevibacillus dissolubilis TaxID=1844116 RepID=UPI00159B92B5|nr:hypothetical protein [Brevibacillus dissolubilis]